MKKITLCSFFLCTILAANSLQAMHNSNNKRMKDEEQSNVNNKRTKTNNNNEESKNLPTTSSNIQLPPQPYQIYTYPQYNLNMNTTNNVVFNIQPTPIFMPPYPLHTPFLIPNIPNPAPQPHLHNLNMDQVKQYLAKNQYIIQNKQLDYQEKNNYSDTYIFDFKESREVCKIYNEIIKPITTVTSVIFKILPSLQQTEFLSKKFPCTQKIDASALFGEGFSNIQSDPNKREKIFDKFHDIVESIKEKSSKIYKNESLKLTDVKRSILSYILSAYLKEPQNPCDYINTLLRYEQMANQHLNNNPQYINNNNNTTQALSQKPYVHTNIRQSTPPSQPKKPLPVVTSPKNTNIATILKKLQQTPVQNIPSKSPFAENNNAQNSNVIKRTTPLFDTNSFIDLILANPMPMDDFSDLTSETKSDLDIFYSNDITDPTLTDANITDKNPYTIQNDTMFVFDNNERKCLAQKIALPSADKINALCFKICPTDLEFFELSENFNNIQKIDLSFVLNTDISTIKSIGQSLKTFEHLKELKLEGNQLTDDVILWISKELPYLEKLILDNNFITDKGAEAISQLYNLKELSIHSNQLTGRSVIKLAELPNLTTFNYDNNPISEADKKTIYEMRKEVLFLHNTD